MPLEDIRKTNPITSGVSSFEQLVHRHYGDVYRFSLRLLNHPADAEDVTQETFIRVYKGLARFKGDSSVSTWIYKIAYTSSMDYLRSKKRKGYTLLQNEEADPMENLPDESIGPEQMAFLNEERARIKKALSQVPIQFRTVIVLREIEDLSYQDISVILGCPVGTVRSRLARGRKLLAEILYEKNQVSELIAPLQDTSSNVKGGERR